MACAIKTVLTEDGFGYAPVWEPDEALAREGDLALVTANDNPEMQLGD